MKHEIEIEGLPEGWEIDKITLPSSLFITANQVQYGTYIKLKKKQPETVKMTEYKIHIPDLPEGWEPVAIRKALDTDTHLFIDGEVFEIGKHPEMLNPKNWPHLIVKKKQPRRIVLEETGEVHNAMPGEYAQRVESNRVFLWDSQNPSMSQYKIWREVKETDLSLHNADDKESLRLTREQCRELLQFSSSAIEMIKDFLRSKS